MYSSIKKLISLLTPHERRRGLLLLTMILVMGLLDTAGVASIMPFMAVLANQQLIQANSALAFLNESLGFSDPQQFLFALGLLVFVTLVLSLAFKAVTTYAQLRFVLMREHAIARRLVEGYLQQPYAWFLNKHSADLGKNVLSEVSLVVNGILMPLMALIANGIVAVALLTLLFVVHSMLALFVGALLAGVYGLVYVVMGGFLSKIGRNRKVANQQRFTVLAEAFGAMKEIKIASLEREYLQRFSRPAESYARQQSAASAVSLMPRFALEAMAFGGMLLAVLYLMRGAEGFASGLPVVTLFAFAGYRLIPALQQVYASLTQLRYSSVALDALHADFSELKFSAPLGGYSEQFVLKTAIGLHGVSYVYPRSSTTIINNINLEIPVRSVVAFVGATGSGKTTIVDLIMGLLEPTAGMVEVDGVPITRESLRKWQRCIGYVPQQIFLADDTIAANIAFGVPVEEIDIAAVECAARIANLHDFVVSELPCGYGTKIGERGVRLSGGQRQRIGIARALYRNPQVLILDEATSALDNLTERAVMEALHNLGKKMTVILIAHRLTTVHECDCIFLLERGRIADKGSFKQLVNTNESFRRFANSS